MTDVLELTRALLAFDTTNPPGREAECGTYVADMLEAAGFAVDRHAFGGERMNVVARLRGTNADAAPLVLTGHLDTVPLGAADWTFDPFAGQVSDGRLYGRGVSDMKAGVAAMIAAATRAAKRSPSRRGLTLIFTSGEETGCAGALALASAGRDRLGEASAMLVGEPTGNRLSTGHKGCVAVRAKVAGVTAHSSMPEKGVNAIYKAARAVARLEDFGLNSPHDALLGGPTMNVGMIAGGLNYNSVPDAAWFTVDVRTTPAMSHDAVEAGLASYLGPEVSLERFVDMPGVTTRPDGEFVQLAATVMTEVLGPEADLSPLGIPFFSDASVFHPLFGCPTLILGPGEPSMAHQTDEYCFVHQIEAAVEIYDGVVARWCA